jgi:hypothetical protein
MGLLENLSTGGITYLGGWASLTYQDDAPDDRDEFLGRANVFR